MIPAIAITAFCSVAQTILECQTNGKYVLAGLNGFLTFLLSVVSFMKLDASAQAYKITAHQYEKLQTSTEFHSGKLLLFHNNYNDQYKNKCNYLSKQISNNHNNSKSNSNSNILDNSFANVYIYNLKKQKKKILIIMILMLIV